MLADPANPKGTAMNMKERAEQTARSVYDILGASPSDDEARRVIQAVEKAIIDAMVVEQKRCTSAAIDCCLPDRDKAHKVATEIRQSRGALIANLSSMR